MRAKNIFLRKRQLNKGSKQCNKNKGFTLVEVLVAITILAIMSLPILSAFMTSSRINLKARQQEHANAVGQKVAENMKALSLTDIMKTMNDSDITIGTSVATGQKTYSLNMGKYDALGNVYVDTSSGDEFYVTVDLDPDDFADKTDPSVTDNKSNNINSYNMPTFTELQSEANFAIMREVYKYDSSAPSDLGVEESKIYRKTDVYVDITTDNVVQADRHILYKQKVTMKVTYYEYGNTSNSKEYTFTIGECAINGNEADASYKNVYLFYNPYDKYRTDSDSAVSRDEIIFHVNDGDVTNMKFNPTTDINGNLMADKKVNLYLVEQEVRNINNSDIIVNLKKDNITVKNGSSYTINGNSLSTQTIGIGGNYNVNLLTNAKCIQTYKSSVVNDEDKTIGNMTNSLTQDMNPDTEIKYLYNMTIKIWINESPLVGNEPFLTLTSTKENAHE